MTWKKIDSAPKVHGTVIECKRQLDDGSIVYEGASPVAPADLQGRARRDGLDAPGEAAQGAGSDALAGGEGEAMRRRRVDRGRWEAA